MAIDKVIRHDYWHLCTCTFTCSCSNYVCLVDTGWMNDGNRGCKECECLGLRDRKVKVFKD